MPRELTDAELQRSLTEQRHRTLALAGTIAELYRWISDAEKPIFEYDRLLDKYEALREKHTQLKAAVSGDPAALKVYFFPATKLDANDDLRVTLRTNRKQYCTGLTVAAGGHNPWFRGDMETQQIYDAEDLAGKCAHLAEENDQKNRLIGRLRRELRKLKHDKKSQPTTLAELKAEYAALQTAHLELTTKITQAVRIDAAAIKAIAAALPKGPSSSRFFGGRAPAEGSAPTEGSAPAPP
jgi:hypothetical protein